MLKKSLPAVGSTILAAVCFIPGRWLGAQFCVEYGLEDSAELWLAVAAFWLTTCAAASALITVFPVAFEGGARPARSLWLRTASLAAFTAAVSLLVFPDQVKIAIELVVWLAGQQSV
jgi:hypothetical protein